MPSDRRQSLKPLRAPRDYLRGDWPDAPIVRVPEDEGGEMVEFMVEQMARVVGQLMKRREDRGLRLRQVAKIARLRPNTVGDVEAGRSWPDMRTLSRLAWALDMDIELEPRVNLRARDPR